jgi:hypothetical protein
MGLILPTPMADSARLLIGDALNRSEMTGSLVSSGQYVCARNLVSCAGSMPFCPSDALIARRARNTNSCGTTPRKAT